jgi:hypothetical protein
MHAASAGGVNVTVETASSSWNPIRLLMRVPVPWAFILAYLVGVGLELAWPSSGLMSATFSVGVVGWGLFVVGAAVAVGSLLIFRKARTTTVPRKVSSALVT